MKANRTDKPVWLIAPYKMNEFMQFAMILMNSIENKDSPFP